MSSQNKAKQNRKKKRISKHILRAQDKKAAEQSTSSSSASASTETTNNKPQDAVVPKKKVHKQKGKKVKDPKEAASYLSLWKIRDTSPNIWKFNTNMQSWLLRNMYDSTLVPKSTFQTLSDYIVKLPEGMTRKRVCDDALSKAMRYKKWAKEEENEGTSKETDDSGAADTTEIGAATGDDDDDWKNLDSHDKRREYKRARIVLESLRSNGNETKSN
mmetsp:Transcript_49435/g.57781  ORF Transcript_49435/g.57781 Transcript_49435/m.57781 type:complete len:216 (+) Transcript_49435:60-707(+)